MSPKRSTRSSGTSNNEEMETEKISKPKKTKSENSVMFLSTDKIFPITSPTNIITLKHPGSQQPAKYILNASEKKFYEIRIHEEQFSSWLVGETVTSDGSIYMTTPVDPLFILLPYVKSQCTNRAIPLDQLLSSEEEKDLAKLSCIVNDLSSIADLKGPVDLCAYKYNEDKALIWLEAKVRRLVSVLKDLKLHVKSGAVSNTFVTSSLKEEEDDDEEPYLKYAHGLVSEYLDDELSQLLFARFNFKPEEIAKVGTKRKSEQNGTEQNKKSKTEKENENEENVEIKSEFFTSSMPNVPVKAPVLTTKEKQLQKAASGTKNIMSFFGKKK